MPRLSSSPQRLTRLLAGNRRTDERGATLVEFAVVFPLLLLLLFAIVDFGRLAITTISISTASREGARYGTATDSGTTPGVPRYVDCAGIKAAAQARIIFGGVGDDDITVQWDSGPGTAVLFDCDGTAPSETDIASTNRILVTVESEFRAITPIMAPFIGTIDLESTDKRTIFKGAIGG